MNIEKMYNDIQQKLKNATTFEKNNYMENLLSDQ